MKSISAEEGSVSTTWSQLTDFILEHYAPAQMWEPSVVTDWVVWAASKKFLVVVYDRKKLVGLSIFRPLRPERAKVIERPDDQYDEDGEVIYIDLAISTGGKPVLKALLFGVLTRLGDRPNIAFFMHNRNGKFKIHSLDKFRKTLLKKR